jgi:hypothetical protein
LHRAQEKFALDAMRDRYSGTKRLIRRYKNPIAPVDGGAQRFTWPDFTGKQPAIGMKRRAFCWD